ncbi:MAG: outer membrane beta-barrel protein [Fibromonadales bacterium]|nr:outer membrane beta-barrel protein [Fibromonadales bacterium]
MNNSVARAAFVAALLLSLLAFPTFATEEWIKKYAFAAGIDIAITRGDLDGISGIKSGEKSEHPEQVIFPEIPFFIVYAFDARALANASSIAFNFGLGFPEYEHREQNGDARYLRLGLEYQYHFFWPEPFRIGTGIGYEFSSMRFPKASVSEEEKWNYANFTGNGPHAVVSAEYFFTENIAIEGAIRYRLLHFNRVATDLNDVSKLSDAVWQGMGEFGIRGMFVF